MSFIARAKEIRTSIALNSSYTIIHKNGGKEN